FLFNNLGYHQLRNRVGLIGGFHQKFTTLENLLGYGQHLGYITCQFAILATLALIENIVRFKQNRSISIYFGISLTLFVLSILPTPVYLQYFCILVPFLVIDSASLFNRALNSKNLLFLAVIFCALILFAYPIRTEILRYTKTGKAVSGVYNLKNTNNWTIATLQEIAKKIDELNGSEEVLTTWPGYLIGSNAASVKGMENHFPISVAHKLTADQLERYKIMSKDLLDKHIQDKKSRLVVLGYRSDKKRLKRVLKAAGYQQVWRKGRVEILSLP
ncbi:MAG: hypothetical protein R3A13_12915, partial [Bdellovibrionota bacterium]